MNKFLVIALISLSVAFACHPSCLCENPLTPHTCTKCVSSNSDFSDLVSPRFCPCEDGYYSKFQPTFSCEKSLSTGSLTMDACKREIGQYTNTILVSVECFYEIQGTKSVVRSNLDLKFDGTALTVPCRDSITTSVQYLDQVTSKYVDFPGAKNYVNKVNELKYEFTFPLIDLFTLAKQLTIADGTVEDKQFGQKVPMKIYIGHADSVIREHTWDLFVYTNRDQVQVFTLNVDIQRTNGCQNGENCIVVADLTTEAKICSELACNTAAHNTDFIVGDTFFGKIWFTDATYTNLLQLTALYYQTEAGKVFNFSTFVSHQSEDDGLYFQLPLVEPTPKATIQVNMKIIKKAALRNLAEESKTVQQQFVASVFSDPNASSSSFAAILAFVNIIAFALLF